MRVIDQVVLALAGTEKFGQLYEQDDRGNDVELIELQDKQLRTQPVRDAIAGTYLAQMAPAALRDELRGYWVIRHIGNTKVVIRCGGVLTVLDDLGVDWRGFDK